MRKKRAKPKGKSPKNVIFRRRIVIDTTGERKFENSDIADRIEKEKKNNNQSKE